MPAVFPAIVLPPDFPTISLPPVPPPGRPTTGLVPVLPTIALPDFVFADDLAQSGQNGFPPTEAKRPSKAFPQELQLKQVSCHSLFRASITSPVRGLLHFAHTFTAVEIWGESGEAVVGGGEVGTGAGDGDGAFTGAGAGVGVGAFAGTGAGAGVGAFTGAGAGVGVGAFTGAGAGAGVGAFTGAGTGAGACACSCADFVEEVAV